MKNLVYLTLVISIFLIVPACTGTKINEPVDAEKLSQLDDYYTFMIANDLGRNGYFDQKPVAAMMGLVADVSGVDFVAALGDVHHFMGVQSVNDPLWMTNFELIYDRPELMIPWHPVPGNHEYRGNVQALLDYSGVSRRWQMPARYYSDDHSVTDSTDILVVFIDTAPIIDKYRSESYGDASSQDYEKQIRWIDSTLSHSDARWKVVMGHHPVYAATTKPESEQTDMQKRLLPVLEKNGVDMYICGHIHIFQHIKVKDSKIDFVVNTSGSLDRSPVKRDGLLFTSSEPGFLLCSASDTTLVITQVNKAGRVVYQYSRVK
ncbi:MAG: metallophosphoesterase [Bacteroidales bacterium]